MQKMLAIILASVVMLKVVGAVYSTLWYALRRSVWPGVPTARLPLGARIAQGLAEGVTNLPGAIMAVTGGDGTPPGTAPPGTGG